MKQSLFLPLITAAIMLVAVGRADSKPMIDAASLEQRIHQQVNRERENRGLAPLELDEKIAVIARSHSRDMANGGFFSHINPAGEDPGRRAERMGWVKKKRTGADTWVTGLAENLSLNHLYNKVITVTENGAIVEKRYLWNTQEEIVLSTVREWMNSPGHRKNLLSPLHDREGIGVAISGDDVYVTQDLF
jgi:uncharacterized protein YkwD